MSSEISDETNDIDDGVDADVTTVSTQRRGKAWRPESDAEVAGLLRRLATTPWLVGDRDDDLIAAVRRNEPALRATVARLGWVLVVERDLVRLRKSAPPRPGPWARGGPSPASCSWFFLLVAAAESMPSVVALGALVTAARSTAAEAGLPSSNDMGERRAIVAALRMLDERGVVERLDGDLDGYLHDDQAPVLLAVHHTRLAHVVANPGTLDPAADPLAWLEQVRREPDPARRMRRALVDDACVHTAFLDEPEAQWMSHRVRGDDGAPLAAAFGLILERRAEGAAFVVPDEAYRHFRELGPMAFPVPGTVAHAALLLCDHAAIHGVTIGGPGTGWRGMTHGQVLIALEGFACENGTGKGGWGAEYAADPALLARMVADLLDGINLVHFTAGTGADPLDDGADELAAAYWWLAPVTGRWAEEGTAAPKAGRHRSRSALGRGMKTTGTGAITGAAGAVAEPDLFSTLASADQTKGGTS